MCANHIERGRSRLTDILLGLLFAVVMLDVLLWFIERAWPWLLLLSVIVSALYGIRAWRSRW